MKWLITLSAVVLAASALPAPEPPAAIVADSVLLANGTRLFEQRNAGLVGFGARTLGGQGGSVWTVWDAFALRDALNSNERRIVYVRGRIDLTVLFTGSPGVVLQVGSFTSVIGGDSNAELLGGGLRIHTKEHVIVQNLKVTNALSYAPGEQPNGNGGLITQVQSGAFSSICNVDIHNSEHVWVDHCEFSDDPWNAAATPEANRRHNGLLTIKEGANMVSVSNNIFRNHNMNFLIGASDNSVWSDTGRLKVTIYRNWFRGVVQRSPRARFGDVHVLNNLFTDITSYAIGVGHQSRIYAERNAFINTRNAWTSMGAGALLNFNNILTNSAFGSGISGQVNWVPSNHYSYTPMANTLVESHVRANAGTWR